MASRSSPRPLVKQRSLPLLVSLAVQSTSPPSHVTRAALALERLSTNGAGQVGSSHCELLS